VRKKSLHGTLLKNYVTFVMIMLAAAVLSMAFLGYSLMKSMSGEAAPALTADQVARADYESMDITDIATLGGWAEILDEENRVVFVKGDKKTVEYEYSSKQLYEMLSYPGDGGEWLCTAANFTAGDGRAYTCLVMIPSRSVEIRLNMTDFRLPAAKKVVKAVIASFFLFLVLFLLNIFLYSKWTSIRISRPLSGITDAINELRAGKLDVRMDFRAEDEFLQIRDAFNEMAEKLEAAREEKIRMEEARNRMFIDISHDLKTPVTVISGYSRALAENMVKDEERKKRYIETIYSKSMYVSKLTEDLFELAKLDFRETGLDLENTDLAGFLRELAAEHYEQMEEKGIEPELDIPRGKVMLMIDRKEMTRAVSNIIVNAVRHNPPGTSVLIGLYDMPDRTDIVIADNGTGIAEEIRRTIFDPFVKADGSRSSEGTGLGLAIASKIVEKHGGVLVLDDGSGQLVQRLRQGTLEPGSGHDTDTSKYRTFFIISFGRPDA